MFKCMLGKINNDECVINKRLTNPLNIFDETCIEFVKTEAEKAKRIFFRKHECKMKLCNDMIDRNHRVEYNVTRSYGYGYSIIVATYQCHKGAILKAWDFIEQDISADLENVTDDINKDWLEFKNGVNLYYEGNSDIAQLDNDKINEYNEYLDKSFVVMNI